MCIALGGTSESSYIPHDAADLNEISGPVSKQVEENSASDGTTNVVIEVSTYNASLPENKLATEDTMEDASFNKDIDRSNLSEKCSSSVQVCSVDMYDN